MSPHSREKTFQTCPMTLDAPNSQTYTQGPESSSIAIQFHCLNCFHYCRWSSASWPIATSRGRTAASRLGSSPPHWPSPGVLAATRLGASSGCAGVRPQHSGNFRCRFEASLGDRRWRCRGRWSSCLLGYRYSWWRSICTSATSHSESPNNT